MKVVAPALLLVLCAAALCSPGRAAAEPPSDDGFVGTWSGMWNGATSGRAASGMFEMTIARYPSGELFGSAIVWPDDADPYGVELEGLSVEANRVRAVFDTPDPDSPEVVLEGVLDGEAVAGRWSAGLSGAGDARRAGTWLAVRKRRRGGP